jgi:hypothetical protein
VTSASVTGYVYREEPINWTTYFKGYVEPFNFLHEDKNRGFLLDRNKIRKDIKIIENDLRFNLFDMLGLIEMSDEVHLMQSSIKDLINSFIIDKPTIYYHTYVRNYPENYNTEGYNKIVKID